MKEATDMNGMMELSIFMARLQKQLDVCKTAPGARCVCYKAIQIHTILDTIRSEEGRNYYNRDELHRLCLAGQNGMFDCPEGE